MSVYSDKKLQCEGHACAKCGHCRDWYWLTNGQTNFYIKRTSARCFYNYGGYLHPDDSYDHYYYDDCFGISSGNEDYDRHRASRIGNGPLCHCPDNHS